MAKSKNKYYVVWVGQNPGIYDNWKDTQVQITGFPNAKYKGFKTLIEAEEAFGQSARGYIKTKRNAHKTPKDPKAYSSEINFDSISVDAACSRNPGIMEYRGVHTQTHEEIFRMGPFEDGTNNIGEFLALVHALALMKKNNDKRAIYTDSRTGLSWLKNKRVKTTLKQTQKNRKIFVLLERAIKWLKNNDYSNEIIKWDTERWGEIPADFGRK
ncbi:MAG: ribonuclease H [Saprospiraceae bacterium]|nr:ribonuclease H [Saprospiraceae bacterium]